MSIAEDDTSTSLLKVPPHSLEAECSVLGGLMLDEMAWDKISSALTADDFYRGYHRVVFRVMKDLVVKKPAARHHYDRRSARFGERARKCRRYRLHLRVG